MGQEIKFSKKLANEMLDLMEELQDFFILKGRKFIFNTFPDEDVSKGDYYVGVSYAKKREILLNKLAELKVITVKKIDNDKSNSLQDYRYSVELDISGFEAFLVKLQQGNTPQSGVAFYLDSDGNFWHEPKDKFCYSMGKTSERLKILNYLVDNKGFQSPEIIAENLGGKNKQTIRTEIRKMRDNFKSHLGMEDNQDIIESKKDSGYRINPKTKIFKA